MINPCKTKGMCTDMSENIKGIMETTMDKLKTMATADTIIGEPIELGENLKAIPISKVSYGFASGGSDIPNKPQKAVFGGGSGAGMSVIPVAFLVVSNDDVKVMPIKTETTAGEQAITMIPELIEKLKKLMKKDEKEENK